MTILQTHRAEFLRAIENFHFERAGAGLYFPKQKVHIGGIFECEVRDPDGELLAPRQIAPNLVVDQALNDILGVYLVGGAQTTAFYIAPFSGNVSPAAGWTGANFASNATEYVNYSESGRQPWTPGSVASKSVDNTGSPAVFTITSGPATLRGAGVLSSATRSGTSGILVAATRFPTDITGIPTASTAGIKYTFQASDDGV